VILRDHRAEVPRVVRAGTVVVLTAREEPYVEGGDLGFGVLHGPKCFAASMPNNLCAVSLQGTISVLLPFLILSAFLSFLGPGVIGTRFPPTWANIMAEAQLFQIQAGRFLAGR